MDLSLHQLRVVVAVHDAGSFTAAAEQLLQAQSSLSRTVLEIERRLDVRLFDRGTRHLAPTVEGREFVAIARATLGTVDANLRHFAGFLEGRHGKVRIATLPSLAAILLPGVISAYRDSHPDVQLSIEDALADEVLDRVRRGTVDLAVTVVSALAQPVDDLDVTPVVADQFCCVFPPSHRFAEVTDLYWSDLSDEAFISFDATTSIRQHVDRALADAHSRPRTVINARNIAAVSGLVAAELGVSVVPGLVLPLTEFASLRHLPLARPTMLREIAVVRAPGRPLARAAADFVESIAEASRRQLELPIRTHWL